MLWNEPGFSHTKEQLWATCDFLWHEQILPSWNGRPWKTWQQVSIDQTRVLWHCVLRGSRSIKDKINCIIRRKSSQAKYKVRSKPDELQLSVEEVRFWLKNRYFWRGAPETSCRPIGDTNRLPPSYRSFSTVFDSRWLIIQWYGVWFRKWPV